MTITHTMGIQLLINHIIIIPTHITKSITIMALIIISVLTNTNITDINLINHITGTTEDRITINVHTISAIITNDLIDITTTGVIGENHFSDTDIQR